MKVIELISQGVMAMCCIIAIVRLISEGNSYAAYWAALTLAWVFIAFIKTV